MWRFASERSGAPATVVASEAVSLPAYGSPEVRTVAKLVTAGTAAGDTFAVSVNTRLSPTATGPGFVAVTIWPLLLKLQPAPAPEA